MGGDIAPKQQEAPEQTGQTRAENLIGAAIDEPTDGATKLSDKESDKRSEEIEATFDKIANFNDRAEKMAEISSSKNVASIIKLDKQLEPLNEEMRKLLVERDKAKTEDEKGAANKKIEILEAKIQPINEKRRAITAKYEAVVDELVPKLAKTVSDGGLGNATLAARMKKGVNVYENLRELNTGLHKSPEPVGLGLTGGMGDQRKMQQISDKYFKAEPAVWAAFQKKIGSIDKAFNDAKTGTENANRTVA